MGLASTNASRRSRLRSLPASPHEAGSFASALPRNLKSAISTRHRVGGVRDRFEALGAKPGQSGRMPPILTANDLPDGPMLYQHIRWLWLIGYADTPTVVSPSDWDRLNALLERATTRAARGDWSFGQEVE